MFGVIPTGTGKIGFPVERYGSSIELSLPHQFFFSSIFFASENGENGANLEEKLMPYLSALADFREKVRSVAREHKVTGVLEVRDPFRWSDYSLRSFSGVTVDSVCAQECDRLRDDVLPELGVRLEDRTIFGNGMMI